METSSARRTKSIAVALVGAAILLIAASWLDTSFIAGVMRQAASNFDPTPATWAQGVGFLAIAGAILALVYLARAAHSALVSGLYLVVGLFFAFLNVIIWTWAASINGAPPLLPKSIADFLGQLYQYVAGPLNAVSLIGAGMALIGAATLVGSTRERATRGIGAAPVGSGDGPNNPA